ncbi:hypothetical protein OU789_08680 [Halocynthiibacter sp. C4]|nr:hypothetical protein [Halocynthiibacter sp. C4]MDE0589997.1 hypothetical protein [Halocynthiibacter sp. C4]
MREHFSPNTRFLSTLPKMSAVAFALALAGCVETVEGTSDAGVG